MAETNVPASLVRTATAVVTDCQINKATGTATPTSNTSRNAMVTTSERVDDSRFVTVATEGWTLVEWAITAFGSNA